MSWITHVLNFLFPPPVPLRSFDSLPNTSAHQHYSWIFATTPYRGNGKKIVHYIKETPDALYINQCARRMAHVFESFAVTATLPPDTPIMLVPVPQHASSAKKRGFSQTLLLAEALQTLLPYTMVAPLLEKTRRTEKQALLSRSARLKNQERAFTCIARPKDTARAAPEPLIVLIDDVATTGSTLLACKTALSERGFHQVIALVFAQ